MAAYVIAQVQVKDPEAYKNYAGQVQATVESHGGRFLARGGELSVLEGDWPYPRVVIIEFPTREDAQAWHDSDVYRPLRELRQSASDGNLVLLSGV